VRVKQISGVVRTMYLLWQIESPGTEPEVAGFKNHYVTPLHKLVSPAKMQKLGYTLSTPDNTVF